MPESCFEVGKQCNADPSGEYGYIDSVYCGSGVDGAGLRCVVFFSGCNLRCPFCHNPETLFKAGEKTTAEELVHKLKRYKGYFKRGGVTLSGGEPFLQKAFALRLIRGLHSESIHVCIETNGHIADAELLKEADSILCDIKNQETDDLSVYDSFLNVCEKIGVEYSLTNVLVPGKNDGAEKLTALALFLKGHSALNAIKFLPFRKLCMEKYEAMHLPFLYEVFREANEEDIAFVNDFLKKQSTMCDIK